MSIDTAAAPAPVLAVGDAVAGFTVERVQTLDNLRATAYIARHPASGAQVLHVHTDDSEKLFAIALRTPPADDSGIAHILEHSVLCGSQRYPVKDPFVELLKTSLASFLNAMTYPDRTVYPCASLNRRDFFNLVDVYCDAVYRPLLREFHFQQEGHRLGLSTTGDTDSDLVIKGIVYNEMKGAYSDFNGTVYRSTKTSLFPDNAYGNDSGGRPDAIPSLTYEAFCDFHRTLYHPSNSLIFSYGDVTPHDMLTYVDERLTGFSATDIDTTIGEQPHWDAPRRQQVAYPIGANEEADGQSAVSLTWMCGSLTNTDEWLLTKLVTGYLLDTDASPLRRALIASGLGKGLMPSGYMDTTRDTAFTVGLRGTAPDAADRVEGVVRACLAEQATGMDRGQLAAALHQLELELGDVPSNFPLHVMSRAYQRWVYGSDPLEALDLQPALDRLRAALESDAPEQLLQRMIIENTHCLVQTFVPDPEHNERTLQAERDRLQAQRNQLSPEQLQEIADVDAAVEAAQREPNTAESLATLPRLARSDVPTAGTEPVVTTTAIGEAVHLQADVLHGDVGHWELAFDLGGIDDDLIEWLPLYATALSRLGAGGHSWDALAQRQEAVMGPVGAGALCVTRADAADDIAFRLTLSSCALHRNIPQMANYLRLRALELDLTEHDRLRELIQERAVHLRNGVIPGGSGYASQHAARGLRISGAINERMGGFTQIRFFEALAKNIDSRFDEALQALSRIRDYLRGHAHVVVATVGADASDQVAQLVAGFDHAPITAGLSSSIIDVPPLSGVAVAADVAYVARVADIGQVDVASAAALHVVANQLRVGYLWEHIRVLGGAYGARTSWDRNSGVFSVSSYRDPHISRTLETFASIPDYVVNDMDLSTDVLEQAIIGSMKSIDRPIRPEGAVGQSLWRYLRGSTADSRQAHRQAILGLTAEQVRHAAREYLAPALAAALGCVLSSRGKLEQAAAAGLDLTISDL